MSESSDPASSEEDEKHPGEAHSAASRFWLTNDAAALLLVVVMCSLILLSTFTEAEVPGILHTAFVAGFTAAVVWLFGKGTAKYIFGGGER